MARIKGAPKAEALAEVIAVPPKVPTALEFWEGGEVRVQNVGPIRGERLLGRIDGPGLYRFVAPNANGKSTLLSLIQRLHSDKLLRSQANITHGELAAFLEIGASRVTFRKSGASGTMEPQRKGTETLPKIESIPSPIDTLITGNNLKGEEPRAKARLEALLTYVPVEADEKRLALLADSMNALAVAINSYPEALATAREWLAEQQAATGKVRGIGGVTFETEADVRAWLYSRQNEGILEAQQSLLDRLNAFGNAGEHALEAGKRRMNSAFGRAGELEPKRGGVAIPAAELDKLPTEEAAAIALRAAENAAAEARVSHRHRIEAGAQREQVRATIPEPIDLSPFEADVQSLDAERGAAVQAGEAAVAAVDAIDVSVTRAALDSAMRDLARDVESLQALQDDLRNSGIGHAMQLRPLSNVPEVLAAVRLYHGKVEAAAGAVEKSLIAYAAARSAADTVGERRESAQEVLRLAVANQQEANDRHAAALRRLETARASVQQRLATLEALAAPLAGATAEEVEAAEQKASQARETSALAGSVGKYRLALADAATIAEAVTGVSELAKGYRASAAETWATLGFIVTEAVNVPFLRVEGLRIFIGYVPQPGRVEGRLAGAGEADGSVQWRNLDDSEMISTAELNQAILRLMLSRRSELGGILILPWEVVGALDDNRARVFSAEAEAAGLVVISERPWRDGDPEGGIYLEKVEAAQ